MFTSYTRRLTHLREPGDEPLPITSTVNGKPFKKSKHGPGKRVADTDMATLSTTH